MLLKSYDVSVVNTCVFFNVLFRFVILWTFHALEINQEVHYGDCLFVVSCYIFYFFVFHYELEARIKALDEMMGSKEFVCSHMIFF